MLQFKIHPVVALAVVLALFGLVGRLEHADDDELDLTSSDGAKTFSIDDESPGSFPPVHLFCRIDPSAATKPGRQPHVGLVSHPGPKAMHPLIRALTEDRLLQCSVVPNE